MQKIKNKSQEKNRKHPFEKFYNAKSQEASEKIKLKQKQSTRDMVKVNGLNNVLAKKIKASKKRREGKIPKGQENQ